MGANRRGQFEPSGLGKFGRRQVWRSRRSAVVVVACGLFLFGVCGQRAVAQPVGEKIPETGLPAPARPKPWDWVTNIMPVAKRAGLVWLTSLYLDRIAGSERNWGLCKDASLWITDRNRDCKEAYWPGCFRSNAASAGGGARPVPPRWCLIVEARAPDEGSATGRGSATDR